MDYRDNREIYPNYRNMAGDRQDFIIHVYPRPESKDDRERKQVFKDAPKDLKNHLETEFTLTFG